MGSAEGQCRARMGYWTDSRRRHVEAYVVRALVGPGKDRCTQVLRSYWEDSHHGFEAARLGRTETRSVKQGGRAAAVACHGHGGCRGSHHAKKPRCWPNRPRALVVVLRDGSDLSGVDARTDVAAAPLAPRRARRSLDERNAVALAPDALPSGDGASDLDALIARLSRRVQCRRQIPRGSTPPRIRWSWKSSVSHWSQASE